MNANKAIALLLLCSCSQSKNTEQIMPIEVVDCHHPDSRFEAAVKVEVEDEFSWEVVYFNITQDDYAWEATLQTDDHFLWWTQMQLYELDCYSEFDYEVVYENR